MNFVKFYWARNGYAITRDLITFSKVLGGVLLVVGLIIFLAYLLVFHPWFFPAPFILLAGLFFIRNIYREWKVYKESYHELP